MLPNLATSTMDRNDEIPLYSGKENNDIDVVRTDTGWVRWNAES